MGTWCFPVTLEGDREGDLIEGEGGDGRVDGGKWGFRTKGGYRYGWIWVEFRRNSIGRRFTTFREDFHISG